jgi:hypothetical protein
MALMYPWATKEYLLWKMSLGQIIMYYNLGFDQLYGKEKESNGSLTGKSHSELKKIRDDMIAQGLIPSKEDLKEKYGDIEA